MMISLSPYRTLIALSAIGLLGFSAQAQTPSQQAPARDSLSIIRSLREDNFRLKMQLRDLQSQLEAYKRSGRGISSIDRPPIPEQTDRQDDGFYSLAERWDALGVDESTSSGAVVVTENDRRDLRVIERLDTLLRIPHDATLQKYIDIYTLQRKTSMMKILGRYDGLAPMMLPIFRKYGVPDELTLLCIVESAASSRAVSPAGAAGLWQLMPDTAREYGLKVDFSVDERYDPKKATTVAARFLAARYREFEDWSLALMSYNCGSGRLHQALDACGDDVTFERLYRNVPKETRDYLPALLAAIYVNSNRRILYED